MPVWEVAALLGHKMAGHSMTEIYAAADPNHMHAAKTALDELLRCICVSEGVGEKKTKSLISMERANGFEPSTLTLAT